MSHHHDPDVGHSTGIDPASFYATRTHSTTPPKLDSLPSSTPLSNKVSSRARYASQVPTRDNELLDLAYENAGFFIGPMPVQDFLDEFMPLSPTTPLPDVPPQVFDPVTKAKVERDMYQPYIDAAQRFAPQFEFVNTSQNGDSSCNDMAPDVCMYRKGDSHEQVTDFSKIALAAEFKPNVNDDPFRDDDDDDSPDASKQTKPKERKRRNEDDSPGAPRRKQRRVPRARPAVRKPSFEKKTDAARILRGQIIRYITAQKMTQFRTCVFFLLICGRSARFIRWDPAGFIVSAAFDYHSTPRLLAEFLWRFDRLSPEGRGYDITAVTPNSEEIPAARAALKDYLSASAITSFVKLKVSNEDDDTVVEYIAPQPKYRLHSPTGRSTRGFVAYDLAEDRVVYVKDQWRVDEPGMEKEQAIYAELHKHGVRHIPRLDRGSDVRDHATVTKSFLDKPWANLVGVVKDRLLNYKHHRLVFRDVGRDLRTFPSTRDLVRAVADAAEAHADAYEKAGILHRDISVGNIIISGTGGGLLIDWELSARVNKDGPRLFERTGTWQFIAAAILLQVNKLHQLQDDLESVLWVLLWTSLKFSGHSLKPLRLQQMLDIFDEFADDEDSPGGSRKRDALCGPGFQKAVTFNSQPLDRLFKTLLPVFASRYTEPLPDDDLDEAKALYLELGGEEAASKDNRFRYDIRFVHYLNTRRLEDSHWIIRTMRALLDSPDWPENDAAKQQIFHPPIKRRGKRTDHQAGLESFHGTISKRIRLDLEDGNIEDTPSDQELIDDGDDNYPNDSYSEADDDSVSYSPSLDTS